MPFRKKVLEKIFAKPLDKSKYRPALAKSAGFVQNDEIFCEFQQKTAQKWAVLVIISVFSSAQESIQRHLHQF